MNTIAVGVSGGRAAADRELAAGIDRIVAEIDRQRRELAIIADTDTVGRRLVRRGVGGAHVLAASDALERAVRELERAADQLDGRGAR